MRLTPTLTLPSPEVSALSANDGPNVVAVRTRRPVLASSLNAKPADALPNGVVATSSAVASASASPAAGLPTSVEITVSVSRSESPVDSRTTCAEATVAEVSQTDAAKKPADRVIVIGNPQRKRQGERYGMRKDGRSSEIDLAMRGISLLMQPSARPHGRLHTDNRALDIR